MVDVVIRVAMLMNVDVEANIEESSSARKRKRANHEYTWVRVLVDKCFVHGVSRESWLIMFRINGSSI